MLLPVPYCLVTVTWPDTWRELARRNPQLLYNPLCRASAAALQQLALDPRCVGGTLGMIGGWHTWPRALHYHPQVHSLVPAGGLARDGRPWRPSRGDFLVPVQALASVFRAQCRAALRTTPGFDLVPREGWDRAWVVHWAPVGTGVPALQDRAPSILRVALSHNRSLTLADGQVTCQAKDSQTEHTTVCTRSAEAFIRRFLPPGLPDHLVKVRYDGFFRPGTRHALQTVRALLGAQSTPQHPAGHDADSMPATTAVHCPRCGHAMELVETLRPTNRPP